MKLLILLLAFLAFPGHAQTTKKAPPPTWLQAPFDATSATVGLHHSPQQVTAAMIKAAPPKKSEFETAVQFNDRLANWSAPLFGTVKTDSLMAFNVPRFANVADYEVNYSAERQEWLCSIPLRGLLYEKSGGRVRIDFTGKDAGSYVGQNAFGVKKRIEVQVIGQWELAIDGAPPGERIAALIQMPPDEAKKAVLNVLLVGKLKSPFRTVSKVEDPATISDPREQTIITNTLHFDLQEVIVYDLFSKKIIHRSTPQEAINKFQKPS